jgi:hypothetical protein
LKPAQSFHFFDDFRTSVRLVRKHEHAKAVRVAQRPILVRDNTLAEQGC